MKRGLFVAGLSALAALLLASPVSPEPAKVARHSLPNGIVVLVRENHAASVVAVSLMVRAGSVGEDERAAGITNFLHRVMVRGTRKHTAARLAEAVEDIGGSIDASGDVDVAEIRGQALARHWEALLSLVAEVTLAPTLPQAEVERERRLILSQIRTRDDTPLPAVLDAVTRNLYGLHPYALHPIGRRASIETLSRDALFARYRELYQPDRLVVAVSGDVSTTRVLRRVERLFSKLAAAAPGASTLPADPEPAGDRTILDRAAQQAQVVVGYLAPRLTAPDYPAVKVLSAILGGGIGSRFFTEIREKRGLAYSLGVVNASRAGPAALITYLGTAAANATEAEAAVLSQIERTKAEPPTDDELARAKAYVIATLAMDRRTNARQAWYLAFFESVGAGWDFPERYVEHVKAVTTREVLEAARRYLTRPTIVILRPPLS